LKKNFFFEKKIYKNEILFLHTFTHSKIRPELKKQNLLKFTFSYTPVSQGRSWPCINFTLLTVEDEQTDDDETNAVAPSIQQLFLEVGSKLHPLFNFG